MSIDNYVQNYFQADTQILKSHGIHCFCNRSWYSLFKKELDEKLNDLKLFVMCSFELNLISQVLYTHFNLYHNTWKVTQPDFNDCRCSYMSNPIGLIRWAKINARDNNKLLKIKQRDILEADEFFLNTVLSNPEIHISKTELISALKNDPDCNVNYLIKILEF